MRIGECLAEVWKMVFPPLPSCVLAFPGFDTNQLADYAVGKLTPEERREVEAHLSTCIHCQAIVGEIGGCNTLGLGDLFGPYGSFPFSGPDSGNGFV